MERSVSQSKVAEFLSPLGNRRGGLRTDFDALRRERVLVLNDSIKAMSMAGEACVKMEDGEGVITAQVILNQLMEELEESIFEEEDDG